MADYVNVQHGDLDDAAAISVAIGHSNLSDYVGFGLDIQADFTTSPPTFDLTSGKMFLLQPTQNAPGAGHDKHECLLLAHFDARSGLELVSTEMNYVWARLNVGTNDSPKIDVTNNDSPVASDSLKIAEIDAANETVTEVNRDPSGDYESVTVEDLDVSNQITWPDGETTQTHPLTYGEDLDNYNAYYDTQATDPPGVVEEATYAQSAGSADTADHANTADLAYDSEKLEGQTLDSILSSAQDATSYEWQPILNQPWEWTDTSDNIDHTFHFDDPYDRYKVALQVDNYNPWIDALYMQINGIRNDKYRNIDLEASEYLDEPEKYDEVRYQRRKRWIIGDTMANSHSIHEFYLACPRPVRGVGNGPSCRYPVFNTGLHHTGTLRTYHLCGNLTQSVDMIEDLRIFSDHEGTAAKVQIYGKDGF